MSKLVCFDLSFHVDVCYSFVLVSCVLGVISFCSNRLVMLSRLPVSVM